MLRFAVFVLLAATLLLTGAQQLGSDGPWWLELSRYLPFPLLLAPAVVALLLAWRLGRRWIGASLFVIVLFATIAMGLEWHPRIDAAGAEPGLRLMTYNVKGENALLRAAGVDELTREIARHDADVVLMQDAHGLMHGLPQGAIVPLFGLPAAYKDGQYIIASRLPMRDCAPQHVAVPGGDDFYYSRCVVDVRGAPLQLVTAHFESPRSGLNAARHEGVDGIVEWRRNFQIRLAQSRALADALAHAPAPFVLAGDLNAPETSAVIGSLLGIGLRDAFSSAGRGYGYTYGHRLRPAFSFLRIDHILVSSGITVADCFVGGKEASDHRPVIADLRLSR